MLGWALNKATGTASNAPPTPGPGTSTRVPRTRFSGLECACLHLNVFTDDTFVDQPDTPAPVFAARAFKRALFGTPAPPPKEAAPRNNAKPAVTKPEKKPAKAATPEPTSCDSPSKPQGILLTPGTGTARRKRVSFGRDVKVTNPALAEATGAAARTRPKTALQEALENSRKRRDGRQSNEDDARKLEVEPEANNDDGDDAWEEIDGLDRDQEGTLDLNEPRSQSGRYWKGEFQKYHEEAQAEMEKLVKYKMLAKSYAKAKDAEAMDLTQRLKEEQAKVAEMEGRTIELAGQLGAGHRRAGGQDDKEVLKDLTRQTALAVQYRKKVDEIGVCLKESGYEADGSKRRRGALSVTREQAKELSDLRQELQRAKSEITALEDRERRANVEKRDLERKLSRKDTQYDSLKADYDALKAKNRALREEVLSVKHTSQSGDTALPDKTLKTVSIGASAPTPWLKTRAELQTDTLADTLDKEAAIRHREMEDASLTFNQLRQDFKKSANFKLPAPRRSSAETRAKSSQTAKFDDDSQNILPNRPISIIKRTATPSTRSISRGSKRTVSGRVMDRKTEPVGLASTRAPPRRLDTPKTIDLARLSSKSRLGLVTAQALNIESDPEPRNHSVPSSGRNVSARSSLPSDRRVAAIARLEQKRAERKKSSATLGKENQGLSD